MSASSALQLTPLNAAHRRLGARMVDFCGWEMPVQYSGIVQEHQAVRTAVGLFDVSHMGEIVVRGPEALLATDFLTTNAVGRLHDGQVQYTALLYEHGGIVDNALVHRVSGSEFFIVVNASNQQKDYGHMLGANRWNAEMEFAGPRYAQLAIQGPRALQTVQKLTKADLSAIRYFWFVDGELAGVPSRIARTGYTGEDGFEVYLQPADAPRLWDAILEAGREFGIKPCGLGARNTLRLEAKMALYGHEIDAETTPLEADLAWIVKLEKGDFLGRAALERQMASGLRRKLVGFTMRGRMIAREGYEVFLDGSPAGWVTSGGPSPTMGSNIGLCYLPAKRAKIDQAIQIMIRGQLADAVTVPTPFYKRAK